MSHPTTPSSSAPRSSFLPTPGGSGIARRASLGRSLNGAGAAAGAAAAEATSTEAKSLAEAIQVNDPAKFRSGSSVGAPARATAGSPAAAAGASRLGALPRPSLAARKSTVGLRQGSQTPVNLPPPASDSPLSHARQSSVGSDSRTATPSGSGLVASPSTPESVPGRSPLATSTGPGAPRGYLTPKHASDVHNRQDLPPPLPTATPSTSSTAYASTIASAAKQQKAARRGRELEIGDLVRMEGSDLQGVLRHLGPVQFKAGYYAGLELTGDSMGKGKNDGSVSGVQYFACPPGNGMFCPASKVISLSEAPPVDAVARPQSAMSNRSGRSSDVFDRPPSATLGRRRSSTTTRPPSTTPGRSSSRASARPSSTTPGSRPASALSSRPASRTAGRKSLASVLDDDVAARRAKTSAEQAASAEARITEGSRAHRFLGLKAKDLQSRRSQEETRDEAETKVRSGSPAKGRPSSPLKDSLLSRSIGPGGSKPGAPRTSGIGTPGLPRPRPSLGGNLPTPRAAKGRVSMFARTDMGPPVSPTKDADKSDPDLRRSLGRPASSLSSRNMSLGDASPSTPSKASMRTPNGDGGDRSDDDRTPDTARKAKDRNRMLLEELDLTPRRPAFSRPSRESLNSGTVGSATPVMPDDLADGEDSVAHPVVPLSLYEEQNAELERLKAQIEELEKTNSHLQGLQNGDKEGANGGFAASEAFQEERAKLRAETEASEKEKDEARKIEREAEQKRREELEKKEKETKEKVDALQKELRHATDDAAKLKSEHESRQRDSEGKLAETEKLVEDLKAAIEQRSAASEQAEAERSAVAAKDAEIGQLQSRVERLAAELERERNELGAQIEELRNAGQETISLYEERINETEQHRLETEERMHQLEQHAQAAIAAAEAQRDAASSGRGGASTAAEIDNENLREQLSHVRGKFASLEDQLAEANAALEQEQASALRRKERAAEIETNLKKEVKKLKAEVERLSKVEAEHKERADELHDALAESKVALENERAEVEGLRADLENMESLGMGTSDNDERLEEVSKRAEADRARFESETERLSGLLEGARSGKREASKQAEDARRELQEAHTLVDDVRQEMRNLEAEKVELENRIAQLAQKNEADHSAVINSLRKAIETKTNEIDILRRTNAPPAEQVARAQEVFAREIAAKDEEIRHLQNRLESARMQSAQRDSLAEPSRGGIESSPSLSGSSPRLSLGGAASPLPKSPQASDPSRRASMASTSSRRSRHSTSGTTTSGAKDDANQVVGLQYMLKEAQNDLSTMSTRDKVMAQELEELKHQNRTLELTVEKLSAGKLNVSGEGADGKSLDGRVISTEDFIKLSQSVAELTAQMERKDRESSKALERERARVGEVENKRKLEVDALHKEVHELEALVEAEIFRKDELECQLDVLKRSLDKAQRQQQAENRKPPHGREEDEHGRSRSSSHSSFVSAESDAVRRHVGANSTSDDEDLCSLCEKRGHSVINCALFGRPKHGGQGSTHQPSPAVGVGASQDEDEACDDCGETGHTLEECPYAAEIF